MVSLALLVGVSVPLTGLAGATVVVEDPDPLPPATDELVELGVTVDGVTVPADPLPEPPPAPPVLEPAVFPEAAVEEVPVSGEVPPPVEDPVEVPGHVDGFGTDSAAFPIDLWQPTGEDTGTGAVSAGPDGALAGADTADTVPSVVTVEVVDADAVAAFGGVGLAFRLTRADGVAEPGLVTVDAVYDAFRNAAGGGFAGRLSLVSVPACALSTPAVAACRAQTPVSSDNQLQAGLLRGEVTVAPDPAATGSGTSTGTGTGTGTSTGAGTGAGIGVGTGAEAGTGTDTVEVDDPVVYSVVSGGEGPDGDFGATSIESPR